jgi:predicted esterase
MRVLSRRLVVSVLALGAALVLGVGSSACNALTGASNLAIVSGADDDDGVGGSTGGSTSQAGSGAVAGAGSGADGGSGAVGAGGAGGTGGTGLAGGTGGAGLTGGTGGSGAGGTGGSGGTLPVGQTSVTMTVAGTERTIVVYVPSQWSSGDPGIVALHGNGDTAQNFILSMGLKAAADGHGVALAAPQALSGHYQGLDWDAYTNQASNIDIAVVRAARNYLQAGGVSSTHTYVLGYSQGGFLSYHCAMVDSTSFAAGHVSAAGSPLGGSTLEQGATRKIPMDLLIGSNDGLLSVMQSSRDTLLGLGFEVRYTELPGVGHCCPLQSQADSVVTWLLTHSL